MITSLQSKCLLKYDAMTQRLGIQNLEYCLALHVSLSIRRVEAAAVARSMQGPPES